MVQMSVNSVKKLSNFRRGRMPDSQIKNLGHETSGGVIFFFFNFSTKVVRFRLNILAA